MIVSENTIRQMVSEAVNSILLESMNMSDKVGINGPLKEDGLEDPARMFKDEWEQVQEIARKGKRVDLKSIFGDTFAYKVWQQYYNAMMSKEGKKALGFMSWMKYVCHGKFGHKVLAYCMNGSYIFGLWSFGYFVTVYLAPNNVAGLYRLISSLCEYSNIVLPVTEDLGKMLDKMGIPKSSEMHDASWRGKTVQKEVFGTSERAINHGIMLLGALSLLK